MWASRNMRKHIRRTLALAVAIVLMAAAACAQELTGIPEDAVLIDGVLYYNQPTINMDADLRLGYVAARDVEINPFLCTQRDLVSLNMLVFESVVELDDQMKPIPLLADSWTKNGDTWTFKLREGVIFHNGAPFTADDVLQSYQRFRDADESNPYHNRVTLIKSMEALDDYTIKVTFTFSGYMAIYAMTFPVVQTNTMNDSVPRGTGPYWYTEYYVGIGVRLEANPLWWKKDPQIQSIAAINYADAGDALEALRTNEINILCTQSSKAAVNRKMSDLTAMDYATDNYEMLIPNLRDDSAVGEIRMRQAVMYALDRASIAENAYLGMGVQCEVPVNPASWLYESQSAIFYYSPERSLQLLYDCGWRDLTGDGMLNKVNGVILEDLTIDIITYNEPTNNIRENAADLVASYLNAVGINTTVTVYSKSRCMQRINERDFDLALIGVQLSEVPNLAPLLQSGGGLNINGFKNDNMETLLTQSLLAQTDDELKSIYSQIQMLVVERLPMLGLLFRSGTVLSRRSLAGLSGLRVGNMMNGIEYMPLQ